MGILAEYVLTKDNWTQEYVCAVCQELVDDVVTGDCNHLFCRACIEVWARRSGKCPSCNSEWRNQRDPVPIVRNILGTIRLRCHNKQCAWEGVYDHRAAHIDACEHESVKCTNAGCDASFPRHSITEHTEHTCPLRIVQCADCGVTDTAEKQEEHAPICPKQRVRCPRQCGDTLARDMLGKHEAQSCLEVTVTCEYDGLEMTRRVLAEHIASCHLAALVHQVQTLLLDNTALKAEVTDLSAKVEHLSAENNSLRDDVASLRAAMPNSVFRFFGFALWEQKPEQSYDEQLSVMDHACASLPDSPAGSRAMRYQEFVTGTVLNLPDCAPPTNWLVFGGPGCECGPADRFDTKYIGAGARLLVDGLKEGSRNGRRWCVCVCPV